jgi:hypothetical protein
MAPFRATFAPLLHLGTPVALQQPAKTGHTDHLLPNLALEIEQ